MFINLIKSENDELNNGLSHLKNEAVTLNEGRTVDLKSFSELTIAMGKIDHPVLHAQYNMISSKIRNLGVKLLNSIFLLQGISAMVYLTK